MFVQAKQLRWDRPFPRTGCNLNCAGEYTIRLAKLKAFLEVLLWKNQPLSQQWILDPEPSLESPDRKRGNHPDSYSVQNEVRVVGPDRIIGLGNFLSEHRA